MASELAALNGRGLPRAERDWFSSFCTEQETDQTTALLALIRMVQDEQVSYGRLYEYLSWATEVLHGKAGVNRWRFVLERKHPLLGYGTRIRKPRENDGHEVGHEPRESGTTD